MIYSFKFELFILLYKNSSISIEHHLAFKLHYTHGIKKSLFLSYVKYCLGMYIIIYNISFRIKYVKRGIQRFSILNDIHYIFNR